MQTLLKGFLLCTAHFLEAPLHGEYIGSGSPLTGRRDVTHEPYQSASFAEPLLTVSYYFTEQILSSRQSMVVSENSAQETFRRSRLTIKDVLKKKQKQ